MFFFLMTDKSDKSDKSDSESNNTKKRERCAICRSKIVDNDRLVLECQHAFHEDCILGGYDDRCPVCRQPSETLEHNEDIKRHKAIQDEEVKKLQVENDEREARRLQDELNQQEDDDDDPPPPPVIDIERGSEEWNNIVQSVVMWLSEMLTNDNNPLERYEDQDSRKSALHRIFHGQGDFLNIRCDDLLEIAEDALNHEMFQVAE